MWEEASECEFEFPFAKFATFERSETTSGGSKLTCTIPNMAILVLVCMNLKCDDEKMSHYRVIADDCPKQCFHKWRGETCRSQKKKAVVEDRFLPTMVAGLSPNFIGTEITASTTREPRVKEGTLSHFTLQYSSVQLCSQPSTLATPQNDSPTACGNNDDEPCA
jgi:hypothetical protein